MPFNINDFKSVMNRYGGPAMSSLFEVELSPSSIDGTTIAPGIITTSDLRFFCQSVSVPGVNLETTYYKPSGVGFPESMPMNVTPDALNCVFLLDSNHRVMTFFHRWISSIMNVAGGGDTADGLPVHQIEYKSRYAATSMTVRHYSTHDPFRSYEYQFSGVYPTQISPVELRWSEKSTPATMTVNFSYSKMRYSGFSTQNFSTVGFTSIQNSIARGGNIPTVVADQTTIDELTNV